MNLFKNFAVGSEKFYDDDIIEPIRHNIMFNYEK
jgi:hypothetical protein